MKNILIWLTCLACCSTNVLCANSEMHPPSPEVHSAFGYVDCGLGPFPFPVPIFGVGVRSQHQHHGLDLSLHASTIVFLTHIKGSLLYYFYPKPSYQSQFYFGTGIGVGTLFNKRMNEFLISPEFVLGKSYLTETNDRRFIQMQVGWPTCTFHDFAKKGTDDGGVFKMPVVTFHYGIAF